MRKRTHLATAAVLALTFATSPAAAANDFRGAWPDVKPSEFTLVQLVDDGYAYGHRSSRELPHLIFDLEHTDRLKFQTMDIQARLLALEQRHLRPAGPRPQGRAPPGRRVASALTPSPGKPGGGSRGQCWHRRGRPQPGTPSSSPQSGRLECPSLSELSSSSWSASP